MIKRFQFLSCCLKKNEPRLLLDTAREKGLTNIATGHGSPDIGLKELWVIPQDLCSVMVQRIFRVGFREEMEESIDNSVNVKNRFPVFA